VLLEIFSEPKGKSNPRRKEEATEKPETIEDSVQQAAESLEPAE